MHLSHDKCRSAGKYSRSDNVVGGMLWYLQVLQFEEPIEGTEAVALHGGQRDVWNRLDVGGSESSERIIVISGQERLTDI